VLYEGFIKFGPLQVGQLFENLAKNR